MIADIIGLVALSEIENHDADRLCAHHTCGRKPKFYATLKIFGVDYLLPLCAEHEQEIWKKRLKKILEKRFEEAKLAWPGPSTSIPQTEAGEATA